MSIAPQRLLVPLDGSQRALQTVGYLGKEPAFFSMSIVLFHVFNTIPDAYYDLEREPKSVKMVTHVRSWEASQKKALHQYMETARQTLIDAGHAPDAVEIKIRDRRKGVARDIIAEARKGYGVVLIRRRGSTRLKSLVMGSVSYKLLEKLSFVPVLLAGQLPSNQKVLIAIDGSANATRALRFACQRFGPLPNARVHLVHALRDGSGFGPSERTLANVDHMMREAVDLLAGAGILRANISTQTATGVFSRAGAIVSAAEDRQWNTIVTGRRGLSKVDDFSMGRVSSKIVQTARRHSVWIVP